MKEIKFRAWDKHCRQEGLEMYSWKEICESQMNDFFDNHQGRYELMQYTGLKDKNGVEVYEGDIVRGRDSFLAGFSQKDNLFGVVDFQDGSFVIKNDYVTHYRWMDYELEVIGNVFENSDLLK